MAKQSILTNKKILWISAGVLLTSGVLTGVLVPVLTSKDDPKVKDTKLALTKTVLNAKSNDETITAMQKLYGLEIKKTSAVADLEVGELKTKYQSANNLATFIFANKNSYQTLFVQGNEQTTNLQEVVLIMSPKNQVREQDNTGNWPDNQVDANDQFNFLITFFKGKVVKVTKLNAKRAVANAAKIIFKAKAYDLVNLFYKFKNADPQASDFGYYNAYLDNENNTKGLALFKDYLLTLKAEDSKVTVSDLTEVQFTKKSDNAQTNTATAKLRFSYQGLSATKTINDFQYKVAYKLTLKAGVENKMADEVQIADIDTTNLPSGVSISNIESSPDYPDGSVIKITFSGGTITSQELPGLTSYQSKAQKLLKNAENDDFTIAGQNENLPSSYNDKVTLLKQLQKKADGIVNNNAKTKVKEILGTATITFAADDQTGILSFIITIGTIEQTFKIDVFKKDYKLIIEQTFISTVENNDFNITGKSEIWPSLFSSVLYKYNLSRILVDVIKNILNKTRLDLDKNILNDTLNELFHKDSKYSNITLAPNDQTGVLNFTINIGRVSKTFTITGFQNYQTKAEALLNDTENSDFNLVIRNDTLPSAYNDKVALINQLKAKANAISNNNTKTKVKEILGSAIITFIPDDHRKILKFTITIGKVSKTFEKNFIIISINQKIDNEATKRKVPTIRRGSENKYYRDFVKSDFIINASDNTLTSEIKSFMFNIFGYIGAYHSYKVTVSISVSSNIKGSKKRIYSVTLPKIFKGERHA